MPDMMVAFVALTPPVKEPVTTGTNQLYIVPAGTMPFAPLAALRLNVLPLQITALMAVGVATGLTATATVKAVPVQLPVMVVTI